ncbi:MAG: hypothetical protein LBQ01_01990 [Prevotellaceae bacterium]|jgi:hypothetical protein|nr:hypothetical protein [Prevotellaceae bacterium]
MTTFLIIAGIVAVIIVILKSVKVKTKPKSLYDQLMEIPGMKQQKDMYDLLSKANEEGDGTEEDEMPEGYGKFGLEATNPVPTNTIFGSVSYLGRLRTLDGVKVTYDRIGPMHAPNISQTIDSYRIFANERQIAILYICPYNKKNSTKAPEGFRLILI